jgi:hypothetical protein
MTTRPAPNKNVKKCAKAIELRHFHTVGRERLIRNDLWKVAPELVIVGNEIYAHADWLSLQK